MEADMASMEGSLPGIAIRRLLSSSSGASGAHAHLHFWQPLLAGVVAVAALLAVAASMLGCFGGGAEEENEGERQSREMQARTSMDMFLGAIRSKGGSRSARSSKKKFSPPTSGTSSQMTDATQRYTSSSGSTSKSPCIRRGPAYSMEPASTPGGFMPSSQLAEQMRLQSVVSCESLDDENGTGASIASLRSANASWEMNSWELDPEEVQVCLDSRNRPWQLGCGGFGRVFRAEMAGSTPVAVKFVSRQSPRELRRFVHEIGILKSLRHTNIVQFLGAFLEGCQMVLVTEYMAGGDLYNVMGHDMDKTFSWYNRGQQVALDVVRGVVHMHGRKIIHLDLKSANILLTRDGTAKIADVGLAKVLSREMTHVSMESTFDWAAPEVLAGLTCSEKADIWSLGVVLWEIVSGEAPKLRQLRPLRCPEECPEAVRDVIVACRASAPEDRPTAREVFHRLSAIVHPGAPRQARSILSMSCADANKSRPAWAPPEHPSGEEDPSFMAAIQEHGPAFAGGNEETLRRWREGRVSPQQHPSPPPWVRSQQNGAPAYSRATSL